MCILGDQIREKLGFVFAEFSIERLWVDEGNNATNNRQVFLG